MNYAERYRTELLDRVIPFWLSHSLDREHGGYFTCLTREGNVYDTRKYLWLQGRAVWMFSKLYNRGLASVHPCSKGSAGQRSPCCILRMLSIYYSSSWLSLLHCYLP